MKKGKKKCKTFPWKCDGVSDHKKWFPAKVVEKRKNNDTVGSTGSWICFRPLICENYTIRGKCEREGECGIVRGSECTAEGKAELRRGTPLSSRRGSESRSLSLTHCNVSIFLSGGTAHAALSGSLSNFLPRSDTMRRWGIANSRGRHSLFRQTYAFRLEDSIRNLSTSYNTF